MLLIVLGLLSMLELLYPSNDYKGNVGKISKGCPLYLVIFFLPSCFAIHFSFPGLVIQSHQLLVTTL